MAIERIQAGATYVAGNAFNPEQDTAIAVGLSLDDLTEDERRRVWRPIAGETFVRYVSERRSGHLDTRVSAEWVFTSTRFATLDELYADRAKAPAPAGLLRCSLPGER